MPYDEDQIDNLEAELNDLTSPTTEDVLFHSQDYDAGIVAAVAARKAYVDGGGGGGGPVDAEDVTVTPFGSIEATDLQSALEEIVSEATSGGPASNAEDVIVADTDGNFVGTDVEAVLAEIFEAMQPLDSDLTAIAALTTTSFGRGLLELANQAALLAAAGAAAAVHAHAGEDITSGTVADARIASTIARDSEVTSAISALSSVYQPLDSDLTSIAALTTTSFGRSLLTQADAAALLTTAGAQPVDSDLTAIAALTTTSYGRAVLALADAAALRTAAGLVIGTDVEAHDSDLTTIAGLSPSNDDFMQRKAGAWANRTVAQVLTDLAAAGTTFQPLDATLTALAAANWAANALPIGTGSDTLSQTAFAANTFPARASTGSLVAKTITDFGLSLVDDADASGARTTLGLVIGTNVQAWDTDLDTWAGKTPPSGTVLGTSDTQTLTNKRITKRVVSTAGPGATPSINVDTTDTAVFTALATAITSMTSGLSGTPTAGQTLWIAFTDNGTARGIVWGASFVASTVALPATTVISTRLDVGFVWDGATWRCVAVA